MCRSRPAAARGTGSLGAPSLRLAWSSKVTSTKSFPKLSGPPGCSASRTEVPSGPIRSITTSPRKSCSIAGTATVPGRRTFRSLIRPRSGTNTLELTPAALSSGIPSGRLEAFVVERCARLARGQRERDPCASHRRGGGGDVEHGGSVHPAGGGVGQLRFEGRRVRAGCARREVGISGARLGRGQPSTGGQRGREPGGAERPRVAHLLGERDLLV